MSEDQDSIYVEGIAFLNGDGRGKDIKKAVQLFEKAAAQGHIPSKRELGILFLNGKDVEKDVDRAYELLSEAALSLDPHAMYNLGIMYERGIGIESDDHEALRLFAFAANMGYPGAEEDADRVESQINENRTKRLKARPVLNLEISDIEIEAACCKKMLDAAMDNEIAVVETYKGPELVGLDEDGFEVIYDKCPFCGKDVRRVSRNKIY